MYRSLSLFDYDEEEYQPEPLPEQPQVSNYRPVPLFEEPPVEVQGQTGVQTFKVPEQTYKAPEVGYRKLPLFEPEGAIGSSGLEPSEKIGGNLGTGYRRLSLFEPEEKDSTVPQFEELEKKAKFPNLYAAGQTVLDLASYVKYIDPDERDRFWKLSQKDQTRELLWENVNALADVGGGRIAKGAGQILKAKAAVSPTFKKLFPKTAEKALKGFADVEKGVPTGDITGKLDELSEQGVIIKSDPKYAGSVNLERQSISKEAKKLEVEMFDKYGEKTVVGHQTQIDEAHGILDQWKQNPAQYEESVTKIKSGQTVPIPEELAHRVKGAGKFEEFKGKVADFTEGKITQEEFDTFEQGLKHQFLDVDQPIASEAGRRLEARKILAGSQKAMDAVGKLKKKLNPRQMKELGNLDTSDPEAVSRFVKRLPDPKLKDYFYEYWYNSILSGVPTHVVNVASNTLWSMAQVPHRAIAGGVDAVVSGLTGRQRTRFANEVLPMLAGMKKGVAKGAKGVADLLRTDKIAEFETKWAQEVGASLGAFERSPNKVVREVGKVITLPTKALRAMDVMANAIGYEGQLQALARRSGNLRGLKGDALKKFEVTFLKNPPESAVKEAKEFGKYVTFMSDPGEISKLVLQGRKVIGKLPTIGRKDSGKIGLKFVDTEAGRLVIPFVNTVGNLMKRGIEMTPGVGLLAARGQNPAEVIAKQLEGAVVGLYAMSKVIDGEITGPLPENKAEKDAFYRQGKQPWSIKFGDKWVSYRRIEPFNTIIASVASAADAIKHAKDDATKYEIFMKIADNMKENLLDSSYFSGLSRIVARHGDSSAIVSNLGASLVPFSGFWRSISRASEALEEGSAKVHEGHSFISKLAQTTPPGLLDKTPAKLDVWGKEITLEGGVFRQWLPYKMTTETNDKTEKALETLGVYPGVPPQTVKIDGEDVKLPDDIYRKMIIYGGSSAKDELDEMIDTPDWRNDIKDKTMHDLLIKDIHKIVTKERRFARKNAIDEYLGR